MKKLVLLGCCSWSSICGQSSSASYEPLPTPRERLQYYVHRTYTSRQRLAFLLADTGLGYALNDPEEWGQAPGSFGARLGSNFGRRFVANSIEFGLGVALHEDARYRPAPFTSLPQRVWYATKAAFTARASEGRTRPAYSRFGAVAGAVLAGSTWRPTPASAPDLLAEIGFSLAGKVPDNLLDEFSPDMRRAGHKVLRTIRRR